MLKVINRAAFLIVILICLAACITTFNLLILTQEDILRKYFIIDPRERMNKYNNSLSDSLGKYFTQENKTSNVEQVAKYIKRYSNTSLFELLFIFKDKDELMKQIDKTGIVSVTKGVLMSERVYPVVIENGNVAGYLMVVIKETGDTELMEGLSKYKKISRSLRFLYVMFMVALAVILLYHKYSAKMKLARNIAEMKASNDGLTGLYTHEYFIKALEVEIEKFKLYNIPIAVVMIDIDRFKTFNDRFGHMAGDRILQEVARIIKSNTRSTDILARYGGEEFSIIMPYIPRKNDIKNKKKVLRNFVSEIKNITERIRKNIEMHKIDFICDHVNVTISAGVAFCYKRRNATEGSVLRKADRTLYKAKGLGRNRVCIDYESATTRA